jgi:TRAP-type C4-dicarboxylate transport system permease small subunit
MEWLIRLNDRLTKVMLILAATLAFLLCFLVVADVIGRGAFNSPVKGTTEMVSLSIVIVCFLQAGYAIRSGGMLHVDMFVNKGSPRLRSVLACVAALAGLGFFAVICYGSIDGAAHAWNSNEFEGEGALRVPVWPARFAVVAGCFMACLSYLLMLLVNIRNAIRGRAPDTMASSH